MSMLLPIDRVWDGSNLKINFRTCFTDELLPLRFELLEIVYLITYSDVEDSLVWDLNSDGVYTVNF